MQLVGKRVEPGEQGIYPDQRNGGSERGSPAMTLSSRFGVPPRNRHVTTMSLTSAPPPQLRYCAPQRAHDDDCKPRRARLWELTSTFHCSIIGTCLTTGDVRRVLAKLDMPDVARLTEHNVHSCGVRLAAGGEFAGKLLNKTLDQKHRAAITRFSTARSADDIRKLWTEALESGDIPGAYWAAMTHPGATNELLRWIFEDVHMLSHLVGAANRADIRQLRTLERALEALTQKCERQQEHLKQAYAARDEAIAERDALFGENRSLAAHTVDTPAMATAGGETALLEKLAKLARRCAVLENRLEQYRQSEQDEQRWSKTMRQREALLRDELDSLETTLLASSGDHTDVGTPPSTATVLYVGGRQHLVPKLQAAAELMGVTLLHHDGGEECSNRLISPLVGKADVVLFPVDCVSHDAVGLVKRTCRSLETPYRALRTSGIGSLVSALRTWRSENGQRNEMAATGG